MNFSIPYEYILFYAIVLLIGKDMEEGFRGASNQLFPLYPVSSLNTCHRAVRQLNLFQRYACPPYVKEID